MIKILKRNDAKRYTQILSNPNHVSDDKNIFHNKFYTLYATWTRCVPHSGSCLILKYLCDLFQFRGRLTFNIDIMHDDTNVRTKVLNVFLVLSPRIFEIYSQSIMMRDSVCLY